jgi:hypothetical protein
LAAKEEMRSSSSGEDRIAPVRQASTMRPRRGPLRLCLLRIVMMGDDAADRCTGDGMALANEMSGNATSGGTADAALCEDRRGTDEQHGKSKGREHQTHEILLRLLIPLRPWRCSMNSQ